MEKEEFYSQSDHKCMDMHDGLEKGTLERVTEEHKRSRLEPLLGNETAKLASKVYEILGTEFGCRLAEPNIILAMSGMKGYADMSWVKLDKNKIDELEQANVQLRNFGLEIIYPKKLKKYSVITSIEIVNFKGLEKESKTTRISGVPPYDSRSGKNGLINWYRKLGSSLEEAQKAGKIPKEVNLEILIEGINFGYPDQAILDFEKCLRQGKIHEDLLETDIISSIPETEKYHGAVPEFYYYPEHKNDPEIVKYVSKAKKILEDFYQSDWFKELSQKQEFQKSRRKAMQTNKEGLSLKRSVKNKIHP